MVLLYEHPLSPYAQKVKIALAEKGIEFECRLPDFMSGATAGYLGNVSEKNRVDTLSYDDLNANTLLHGSPETVVKKLRHLEQKTGMTSLLLHYPPYYGHEKTMKSLGLFASSVMPEFRK